MVWVYNDPLTQDEKRAAEYLQKHLKKKQYITKIVKLLSLLNYLKSKKFRSSEQLRSEIFLDKERPLFDEKTASQVYKALYKKRGGGEYPFTESLIRGMASFLKSYDPVGISWVIENGLWVVTLPTQAAKGILGEGIYDLASGSIHGLLETGVSGVNGVAADAGGPIGLAAVGLFTGIAAAAGSAVALSEGDFAQSVVHAVNFVPGIGPALVKGMNKVEHLAKTVDKHRDQITNIPFVGETLTSWVPSYSENAAAAAAGGKRFSVRRRIRTKWPRTQRQRFARR
jgi:hypothetical protein